MTSTCLACLLLAALPGAAPTPSLRAEVDAGMERHLRTETRVLSERFLDGAATLEQWKKRLPQLRREYLDMLGLWPLPRRTPLEAVVTGTR